MTGKGNGKGVTKAPPPIPAKGGKTGAKGAPTAPTLSKGGGGRPFVMYMMTQRPGSKTQLKNACGKFLWAGRELRPYRQKFSFFEVLPDKPYPSFAP